MLRRLAIATALLGVVAAFGAAAPALAATIGQTGFSVGVSCGSATRIQSAVASSGASFVVPTGRWLLSSWSTLAGTDGGQMAVVVLRSTGTPGRYTVVGASATVTLTANTLNTFPASISVQGGDLLGIWASGADCVLRTSNGGDGEAFVGGSAPSAGNTLTLTSYTGYVLNISATLTASPGAAVPQTNSMFICYSKFEQDGGAVFEVGRARALLASGYWLPSAVAGIVSGADNISGYHLECNPPSTLMPSGMYLGGGGDIVDAARAKVVGEGYYPIVS